MRRRSAAVGLVLLVVAAVVGVEVVYVHPATEAVSAADPADAVVALAGVPRSVPAALALVERGAAPELVVSNAYGPGDAEMAQLCASRPTGYRVTCFVPDPSTTRGEARALAALSRDRGWDDVVVVTSTFHVSRARVIVRRCYPGRLRMQASAEGPGAVLWAYNVVYQTAAFVKAAVLRGC